MTKPVLSPEALLALWQALENGPTAKEIAAVDDACVESLYALGHDLYKAENFRDAEAVFRALAFLNPKDRRFWMGLGGARQGLGHFSEASDAYQLAALASGLGDPEPLLYAAQCFLQMKKKDEAKAGLEAVLRTGDPSDARTAECRSRAADYIFGYQSGETFGCGLDAFSEKYFDIKVVEEARLGGDTLRRGYPLWIRKQ